MERKSMENKLVGVLGGLGPLATVYYCDMVITMTDAKIDQEHVDMIISNKASTPDRTGFILGKIDDNPAETIISEAKKLEDYGADFLVLTCNTAHHFYDEIQGAVGIKLLNMVDLTVREAIKDKHAKVGILATTGNLTANLYQKSCEKQGIDYFVPDDSHQKEVMSIIYDYVKAGIPVDMDKFYSIIDYLKDNGCDGAILGCTELSIIKKDNSLPDSFYIDSSEVIAKETIIESGKKLKK